MNKLFLVGRIGQIETKTLPSGQTVTKFSICEDFRTKKGDEWITEPNWFNCTVWGSRGLTIEKYKKKGDTLAVYGTVRNRVVENEQGKRVFTEVLVDDFTLFYKDSSSRDGGGEHQGHAPSPEQGPAFPSESDGFDPVPF